MKEKWHKKKILKLLLPPMLTVLIVTGYNFGAMEVLAKTITTYVATIVETQGTSTSGGGYEVIYVTQLIPTLITVPDEPQISRKVVPEEKPAEIPQTAENNYGVFQEDVMKQVQNVTEASVSEGSGQSSQTPVVIDTGVWYSFKENVYQTLQDSNRPIQITFCYKGERYRVDIPAGADLMSLVDENGYCGFLNLMAHFGGTKL